VASNVLFDKHLLFWFYYWSCQNRNDQKVEGHMSFHRSSSKVHAQHLYKLKTDFTYYNDAPWKIQVHFQYWVFRDIFQIPI
jgi:hypothetical protein